MTIYIISYRIISLAYHSLFPHQHLLFTLNRSLDLLSTISLASLCQVLDIDQPVVRQPAATGLKTLDNFPHTLMVQFVHIVVSLQFELLGEMGEDVIESLHGQHLLPHLPEGLQSLLPGVDLRE